MSPIHQRYRPVVKGGWVVLLHRLQPLQELLRWLEPRYPENLLASAEDDDGRHSHDSVLCDEILVRLGTASEINFESSIAIELGPYGRVGKGLFVVLDRERTNLRRNR